MGIYPTTLTLSGIPRCVIRFKIAVLWRKTTEREFPLPPPTAEPTIQSRAMLVDRFCAGSSPVEASLQPESAVEAFKACIDRGYAHIKFINSGGTELGVNLDEEMHVLSESDFISGSGKGYLEGRFGVANIQESNQPEKKGDGKIIFTMA